MTKSILFSPRLSHVADFLTCLSYRCFRLGWLGNLPHILVLLLAGTTLTATAADTVRNGGLGRRGANPPYFTQETVQKLRDQGWTCPDVDQWPWWWSAWGQRVTMDWPRQGGRVGGHGRISGAGGFVSVYHGHPITGDLVLTIWVRGNGKLKSGLMAYALVEGKAHGLAPLSAAPVVVNSKEWIRVRCLLRKTPRLHSGHVTIACPDGTVDFDEVDLVPATSADILMVEEEERLRASGGLLENADVVLVDTAFRERAALYREATAEFEKMADQVAAPLRDGLRSSVESLDPYVRRENKTAVHALHYNEMLVLTRVLKAIAGQEVPAATAVTAAPAPVTVGHRPGERAARAGTVTITDVRSDKVRYDENEIAATKATLVNTSDRNHSGTLVAAMHLDVDINRQIARQAFSIPAGATQTWSFRYNVGPETYGRGIEVRFVDDGGGKVVDSWQEHYAVAAEWFRVQQHTTNSLMKSYTVDPWVTYFNQEHNFACEPTDWGVQVDVAKDLENYISSQPLYRLNLPARRARYAHLKRQGIKGTFYQTFSWSGQMGYEVIRQHPEFALCDANGQFAVDPVYGGYPNPMELASPIETGPNRVVNKPYLDRKLSAWQHSVVNYAMEDVVRYMAEQIREYAEFLNCGGVYVDGNLGVWKGYGYDGAPNVPSDKYEDYVRLSARNHRLFSGILKKGNPNFGTWFNWAAGAADHYWVTRGLPFYLGSGWGEYDPRDDAIRAAADWSNVMFLNETPHQFRPGSGRDKYPDKHLEMLSDNRDYIVQKHGANAVLGYVGNSYGISLDAPGPDRWGWATHNYFGAQLIATQTHIASWFVPSWRPTLQFMTRYSRLIWAPDVKIVPDAQQQVQVDSPESVWWKRLVYRRATGNGYDLIVHLIRKPPYEKWDLGWLDEPEPLEGARIRVQPDAAGSVAQKVYAMRPYYFDEEQQPVQWVLEAKTSDGRVEVEVPKFRYHTMLVFRVNM